MRKIKVGRIILWLIILIIVCAGIGTIAAMNIADQKFQKTGEKTEIELITETETETEEKVINVPKPEVSEQLLTVNEYSRPGKKLDGVKYLVIHYLGNPDTTAQQNRDYFESLKDLQNVSMSANYVIGLEGEIIHCVPDDEIAYASNGENHDSISIEDCHMDETGKFMRDTYISLVKLTAYLSEKYDIDREHVIRHYDVNGKECPLFYVKNENYWEEFKDDVFAYRELCKTETVSDEKLEKMLKGISHTYKDIKDVKSSDTEKEKEKDTEVTEEEQYEEHYETESYYEPSYSEQQYYDNTSSATEAPAVQETSAPVSEAAAETQGSTQEAAADNTATAEQEAPADSSSADAQEAPADSSPVEDAGSDSASADGSDDVSVIE